MSGQADAGAAMIGGDRHKAETRESNLAVCLVSLLLGAQCLIQDLDGLRLGHAGADQCSPCCSQVGGNGRRARSVARNIADHRGQIAGGSDEHSVEVGGQYLGAFGRFVLGRDAQSAKLREIRQRSQAKPHLGEYLAADVVVAAHAITQPPRQYGHGNPNQRFRDPVLTNDRHRQTDRDHH